MKKYVLLTIALLFSACAYVKVCDIYERLEDVEEEQMLIRKNYTFNPVLERKIELLNWRISELANSCGITNESDYACGLYYFYMSGNTNQLESVE